MLRKHWWSWRTRYCVALTIRLERTKVAGLHWKIFGARATIVFLFLINCIIRSCLQLRGDRGGLRGVPAAALQPPRLRHALLLPLQGEEERGRGTVDTVGGGVRYYGWDEEGYGM